MGANADELGVQAVPSLNMVYTEEADYVTADEASEKGYTLKKLSGTKFRQMLRAGEDIPEWFAFKSVVEVLRAEWSERPTRHLSSARGEGLARFTGALECDEVVLGRVITCTLGMRRRPHKRNPLPCTVSKWWIVDIERTFTPCTCKSLRKE